MAVAALVLGIVGLILSLVPCLGMYAMPLTVLGAILGIMGMKNEKGKGMAIAGMVCGIIGTLIAGWWIYAYLTVKNAADDAAKNFDKEMKKQAAEELKKAQEEHGNAADKPAPAAPADDKPAEH